MFFPLYDHNYLRHVKRPVVNWALIALTCAIHALIAVGGAFASMAGAGVDGVDAAAISFGVIPSVYDGDKVLPAGFEMVAPQATLVTYAFLHGDIMHLGSNMLFVWVFGDNVVDALGHLR